jgi:8-hydroxy-5-deazaflavin:NADPH oxidoreductase
MSKTSVSGDAIKNAIPRSPGPSRRALVVTNGWSDVMRIGTIGTGAVAVGFARFAIAAGHEVVLGTRRNPNSFDLLLTNLGQGASLASVAEAAAADVVLLAVPWASIEDALLGLPPWNNRILIDASNQYLGAEPNLVVADLGGRSSSVIVAQLAPGARLVKAFSSIDMDDFEAGPNRGDATRILFISGDDNGAKTWVRGLIRSFGFAAIDLGGLESGGLLQQPGGSISSRRIYLIP